MIFCANWIEFLEGQSQQVDQSNAEHGMGVKYSSKTIKIYIQEEQARYMIAEPLICYRPSLTKKLGHCHADHRKPLSRTVRRFNVTGEKLNLPVSTSRFDKYLRSSSKRFQDA